MQTTDQLFADNGWEALYDVFVELDIVQGREPVERSPERLRELFEALPESIRDVAHSWSLGDTVFRDDAYEYYRDKMPPVLT